MWRSEEAAMEFLRCSFLSSILMGLVLMKQGQALVDNSFRLSSSESAAATTIRMTTSLSSASPVLPDPRLSHWARAASDFLRSLDCAAVTFTSQTECQRLQTMDTKQMSVYLAGPRSRQRMIAVLPDGGLSRGRSHDAVLVIDPYPAASFGHLVLVFSLDLDSDWEDCRNRLGWYIGDGECIHILEKRRCRNKLHRKSGRRRCEVNFLPLVHLEGDSKKEQQLRCFSNTGSFGSCPQYRTDVGNYTNRCELSHNTYRCEIPVQHVNSRCKYYEICDQAVLISGGWNRQISQQRHAQNIRGMYSMLREHGFKRPNIKTFFADSGDILLEEDEHSNRNSYPATQKDAIRNHISTLCRVPNCVETLVIYLNSPTTNDGTSLLWDTDNNGVASDAETYSTMELLEDLEDCRAKRIYVIADQSYSGLLAESIIMSESHGNVVVFASSGSTEYAWNDELTWQWIQANHTTQCVDVIFEDYMDTLSSVPAMAEGGFNAANSTIFGAPCETLPFFTPREIKTNFMGCQNLPMAWWLFKFQESRNSKS
ncbi:uncharacterized protein LOC110988761 [Acanthaster planci]|uniref:Uncharacterized protein LOC110988761 n=1 Tax=Acanthaster planci TaxID=133434 RepID=A0A8B7ZT55_ACAPL|nr:uncharacterized protein LOC110988761 [Acanthaster planci]